MRNYIVCDFPGNDQTSNRRRTSPVWNPRFCQLKLLLRWFSCHIHWVTLDLISVSGMDVDQVCWTNFRQCAKPAFWNTPLLPVIVWTFKMLFKLIFWQIDFSVLSCTSLLNLAQQWRPLDLPLLSRFIGSHFEHYIQDSFVKLDLLLLDSLNQNTYDFGTGQAYGILTCQCENSESISWVFLELSRHIGHRRRHGTDHILRQIRPKLKQCHLVVAHEETAKDTCTQVNLITMGHVTQVGLLTKIFWGGGERV